jgi:hypothetical protein
MQDSAAGPLRQSSLPPVELRTTSRENGTMLRQWHYSLWLVAPCRLKKVFIRAGQ